MSLVIIFDNSSNARGQPKRLPCFSGTTGTSLRRHQKSAALLSAA
jgi:hypothetical protein